MVKYLSASAGDARDMGSIPGLEDPGKKVGQPTSVSSPVKSHGQGSLAGYSPQGHKESDMTEHTQPYMRDCFFFCYATRLVGS